jgi:hypothetical protein
VKNLRALGRSRRGDTYRSITCACWSTARYTVIWSDLLSIGRVRRPSRLFEAGASCFVVVGLASVSLATRGQTDIRGLDTAGRCFRQERDRVSSVERREPLR